MGWIRVSGGSMPSGSASFLIFRRPVKRAAMLAFCHSCIPASAVTALFRLFRLRSV